MATQEEKILITSEFNSKGLDSLEKSLGKNSKELQFVKGFIEQFELEMKQMGNQTEKTSGTIDKQEIKLGKLGKQLATTTKGLGKVTNGVSSLVGSFAMLAPLVAESDSKFSRMISTVQTFEMGAIGLGGAMSSLRFILPSVTAAMLGWVAVVGAAAAGITLLIKELANSDQHFLKLEHNMNDYNKSSEMLREANKKNEIADGGVRPEPTSADKTIGKLEYELDLKKRNLEFDKKHGIGVYAPKKPEKSNSTGRTEKVSAVIKEEKEYLTQIETARKQEFELLNLYNQENISIERKILLYSEVLDVQKKINELNPFNTKSVPFEFPQQQRQPIEEVPSSQTPLFTDTRTLSGEANELLSAVSQSINGIQNIFDILNVGTDTFLSKMLKTFGDIGSVFQSILATIEGFRAVQSVFSFFSSFIPGGGATNSIGGGGGSTQIFLSADLNAMQIYQTGRRQTNNYSAAIKVV